MISFFIFIFFYYFSNENVKKITQNRLNIQNKIDVQKKNVPIFENDTNNVIEYNSDQVKEKKIKKRYFWKLLNKKNE